MRILLLIALLLPAWAPSASLASTADAGKPTPVPAYTDRVWGDILCNGQVDGSDAIPVLEWIGHVSQIYAPQGCPGVFLGVAAQGYAGDWRWGDVDCSGVVGTSDVMAILRAAASLPSLPSSGCPSMAQTVPVAIVGK